MDFQPAVQLPPHFAGVDAIWFVFREGHLLVNGHDSETLLPVTADIGWFGIEGGARHYLGVWAGQPVFAVRADDPAQLPPGYVFEDLRKLLMLMPGEVFRLAGRAIQILDWERNHRYCGRCGRETRPHDHERAVVCGHCDFVQYPRINPCVIMLVTRGEELLLARSARFNRPMYSTLAGFIEAGETAEETLHREVFEEVGLTVRNPVYFGSQSWPFPGNLMLGFHAEYAGGEINPEPEEILDARFFHYTALPLIPPPGSIAHALIHSYIQRLKA